MKKKLLDRRGAAIELAIMMMVFSIFITTIILTTALLQNEHKAKAELGIKQDIFLEQLGEDFVDAVLKGEMNTNWKPEDYDGIIIETTPIERHAWVEGETVAPTCEEYGYTLRICASCNEVEKINKKPALGHNISEPLVINPSCTTTGKEIGKCSRCAQENAVNLIAANGHNWEKSEEKAATCTTEGGITYRCVNENCNEGYLEIIPKLLEHTLYVKTEITSGCLTTVIYGCRQEGCEDVEVPLETYNHNDVSVISVSEPTCTEDGWQTQICSACKKQDTVTIPMLGHAWDNGVETNAPSCTVAGEKTCTCTVCGGTTTKETAENGHSFDENGKCTVCNASSAYVLTVVAVSRDAYKLQVLDSVPETESCDTAVLQIVLVWSETDNAYKITEWSKK